MITARAPGKLFIAGEYAVVEAGEPAVLVAVDRYLDVTLTELDEESRSESSKHVLAAIQTVEELRRARGLAQRHYDLEIQSELDDADGRKFGLGSSAAVTVATIDVLNQLYGLQLSKLERFKLALLATITISPLASGGDLAASTFGGWIRYVSPDREALREHHSQRGILAALESEAWEPSSVLPLPAPAGIKLLVGWTQSPASTEKLVARAASASVNAPGLEDRREFLERSRECVTLFSDSLVARGDATNGLDAADQNLFRAVRQARSLLQQLSENRSITIETPALRALCEIAEQNGAAAKSSGAGGGDCGIALAGQDCDVPGILRGWAQQGITPLNLEVHEPTHFTQGAANEF